MVQQTVDSKVREYGMGTSETEFSTGEKQLPVAVKKTVLRDLQNDNRVRVPNSIEKSPLLKDTSPLTSPLNPGVLCSLFFDFLAWFCLL